MFKFGIFLWLQLHLGTKVIEYGNGKKSEGKVFEIHKKQNVLFFNLIINTILNSEFKINFVINCKLQNSK